MHIEILLYRFIATTPSTTGNCQQGSSNVIIEIWHSIRTIRKIIIAELLYFIHSVVLQVIAQLVLVVRDYNIGMIE